MRYYLMSGQRPRPLHPARMLSGHALSFNKAKDEKPAPWQPTGRSPVRVMRHAYNTPAVRAQPGQGLRLFGQEESGRPVRCQEENAEESQPRNPGPSSDTAQLPRPHFPLPVGPEALDTGLP